MNKYKLMWGIGLACYIVALVLTENSTKGLIQIGFLAGTVMFMNASQEFKKNASHDKSEQGGKDE